MAEIQLPGKSLIQAYPTGGEVSLSAAAAPARALQQVGNAVQQLGEKGQAMIEAHLRVDNLRMANEMELRANEVYSQFQMDTANDSDPKTVPGRWTKVLKEFEAKNLGKNLTPAQKAVLGERFSQFASNTTVNIAKNAFQENVRQSKISSANIIEQSLNSGRVDRGREEIGSMVANRIVSDAEGESLLMDLNHKAEVGKVEALAISDPRGTQEQLNAKDESGEWQNFKSLDPNSRSRLVKSTEGLARDAMSDAVDHALDAMADTVKGPATITTAKQLEHAIGGVVPPRVLEKLQNELARKYDAKEQARRSSPGYQQQTIGEVSSILADFKPEDPEYDRKFVEASLIISSLPVGAVKTTLNSQLMKARKGVEEDTTYGDFVLRQMDQRNRAVKRETPEKIKVLDLVKKGFLKEEARLMRFGFSAKQAEKVKEAAEKSPEAGQQAFKDQWKLKKAGSVQASEIEIATAKALMAENATIDWNDPESEKSVLTRNASVSRAQGIAKMKMIQFLQLEPGADKEKIDKAFETYMGEPVRAQASGCLVGSRPVMGGGFTASDALLPPKPGGEEEVRVDSIDGSSTFRYDPSTGPYTLDVPSDEELLPVR